MTQPDWPARPLGLSRREGEILESIAQGLNNRQIAAKLTISEDTVKTHVRSILRKLKVSNRMEAAGVAEREGTFGQA